MKADAPESDSASARRRPIWTVSILAASLGLLNIFGLYSSNRPIVYVTKPATMVAIIFLASFRAALAPTRYAYLIIVGLTCSLAGDVFLMLPSDQFVAGLVSFLIAHIFYIVAFRTGIKGLQRIWLALPFYAAGAVVFLVLLPNLEEMKLPVLVYLVVILTMAWQSLHRWQVMRDKRALCAFAGAVLFVISDSIIAFSRFRASFFLGEALIMSSYFAAQWLIAMSI